MWPERSEWEMNRGREGVERMERMRREAVAVSKQISSGEKMRICTGCCISCNSDLWRHQLKLTSLYVTEKPSASSFHHLQHWVCAGWSECVQKCRWKMKAASWPTDVSPPSASWISVQIAALMSNLFLMLTNWLKIGHLSHSHLHRLMCKQWRDKRGNVASTTYA